MSALKRLRRDVHALGSVDILIVALTPLGVFALGLLVVFPARFF